MFYFAQHQPVHIFLFQERNLLSNHIFASYHPRNSVVVYTPRIQKGTGTRDCFSG